MIRNYNNSAPGTSHVTVSNSIPMASNQVHVSTSHQQGMQYMQADPPVNLASKVAEVFLTAGHAFQKLGDLTLQLHSTTEPEECKWTEKDVDQLRDSLTRFAHELDMISQSVQGRTTKHIKTDIKRRHFLPSEDLRRAPSPGMKRPMQITGTVMPSKRMSIMPTGQKTIPVGSRVPIQTQQRIVTHTIHPSNQMVTPLLSEPSHHYTRSSDIQQSGYQHVKLE